MADKNVFFLELKMRQIVTTTEEDKLTWVSVVTLGWVGKGKFKSVYIRDVRYPNVCDKPNKKILGKNVSFG